MSNKRFIAAIATHLNDNDDTNYYTVETVKELNDILSDILIQLPKDYPLSKIEIRVYKLCNIIC